jgi:hypothetical protein
MVEPFDLPSRWEALDGDARGVVTVDKLLGSPSFDESSVALGRDLDAVQARTDRVA